MLPLLIVLGATGALLEFKRLATRAPREGDLGRLQQSEEKLKRVLQEVQRELQQERSEHERDHARAEELERFAAELKAAHEELTRRGRELERQANGLLEENAGLQSKVTDLQAEHAEELKRREEAFETELESLRGEVQSAFGAFTAGSVSSSSLLDKLAELGVEVGMTKEQLDALPGSSSAAAAPQVELHMNSDWRSHLRLLTDDPERVARQLAEGAHRSALSSGATPAAGFPSVRTPPRDRRDGSIFSSVPGIAMSVFTPRSASEKENCGDSGAKQLPGSSSPTAAEPLKPRPYSGADATAKPPIAAKKPPTPTRKRHHAVPRLGLSVALRGDGARPAHEQLAFEDLSLADGDYRVPQHSIVRK